MAQRRALYASGPTWPTGPSRPRRPRPGATPARSSASRMHAAPSSYASTSLSAPPNRPIAVRTPPTRRLRSPFALTRLDRRAGGACRPRARATSVIERRPTSRSPSSTSAAAAAVLRELRDRVDQRGSSSRNTATRSSGSMHSRDRSPVPLAPRRPRRRSGTAAGRRRRPFSTTGYVV